MAKKKKEINYRRSADLQTDTGTKEKKTRGYEEEEPICQVFRKKKRKKLERNNTTYTPLRCCFARRFLFVAEPTQKFKILKNKKSQNFKKKKRDSSRPFTLLLHRLFFSQLFSKVKTILVYTGTKRATRGRRRKERYNFKQLKKRGTAPFPFRATTEEQPTAPKQRKEQQQQQQQ